MVSILHKNPQMTLLYLPEDEVVLISERSDFQIGCLNLQGCQYVGYVGNPFCFGGVCGVYCLMWGPHLKMWVIFIFRHSGVFSHFFEYIQIKFLAIILYMMTLKVKIQRRRVRSKLISYYIRIGSLQRSIFNLCMENFQLFSKNFIDSKVQKI